jgi:hypothetical protein
MGLVHRDMAFAMNRFLIATRDYEHHFYTIDNVLFRVCGTCWESCQ